jgi:hypothetical protein
VAGFWCFWSDAIAGQRIGERPVVAMTNLLGIGQNPA